MAVQLTLVPAVWGLVLSGVKLLMVGGLLETGAGIVAAVVVWGVSVDVPDG